MIAGTLQWHILFLISVNFFKSARTATPTGFPSMTSLTNEVLANNNHFPAAFANDFKSGTNQSAIIPPIRLEYFFYTLHYEKSDKTNCCYVLYMQNEN